MMGRRSMLKLSLSPLLAALLTLVTTSVVVDAFVVVSQQHQQHQHGRRRRQRFSFERGVREQEDDDDDDDDNISNGNNSAGGVIPNNNNNRHRLPHKKAASWEPELYHLLNKTRLEDSWTNRLRKSRPRFLSYPQCRTWATMQNMWSSEREWKDWIEMGEKHVSVVPSDPARLYQEQGTWVSWEDFLGVDEGSS